MPTRSPIVDAVRPERQITRAAHGHILTNTAVWSPDSRWIAYDTRSTPDGSAFDGRRIERVQIDSGEVRRLYETGHGAHCGVVTFHPQQPKVVFILGPEHPTPEWSYNAWHRQGAIVDVDHPGDAIALDARDLVPPFTPGALRGGSHVHVWDPLGQWVSFTYEDHMLAQRTEPDAGRDLNQRNVGVCFPRPVTVPRSHPRNHDGTHFSVLVTRTTAQPRPGSDDVTRACEEGWVGTRGYLRPDGTRQRRALAFQGDVLTADGQRITEVFMVDLPDDLSQPGDGPLQGTETRRPAPPFGTVQRRLTHTAARRHPGLQGPRHWLRSNADGTRIACLMRDDAGVVQLWTVAPTGDPPEQITDHPWPVASAFSWSPDGQRLAYVMDRSVFITDLGTRQSMRVTRPAAEDSAPRPEACVFSPDGKKIAYVRPTREAGQRFNQIFVVDLEG